MDYAIVFSDKENTLLSTRKDKNIISIKRTFHRKNYSCQ